MRPATIMDSIRNVTRAALVAALVASSFVACNAQDSGPGSETNWLKSCTADSECSVGSCVCGFCDRSCTSTADCAGLPSPASCATLGSSAYAARCGSGPSPAGVCLPNCGVSLCDAGQTCISGVCRGPALPASVTAFVSAFCATARTCCSARGSDPALLSDCEGVNSVDLGNLLVSVDLVANGMLEPGKFASLVQEGSVSVDESALAQCVLDLQAAATACGPEPIASCGAAFHGTVPEGGACRLVEECAVVNPGDTAYCVRRYDANTDTKPSIGTCHQVPHAHAGEACNGDCTEWTRRVTGSKVCSRTWSAADPAAYLAALPTAMCHHADGLSCLSGTCQASRGAGDSCLTDDDCGDGFNCPAGVSTCSAEAKSGESCLSGCAEGLACASDQNLLCAPRAFSSDLLCSATYF